MRSKEAIILMTHQCSSHSAQTRKLSLLSSSAEQAGLARIGNKIPEVALVLFCAAYVSDVVVFLVSDGSPAEYHLAGVVLSNPLAIVLMAVVVLMFGILLIHSAAGGRKTYTYFTYFAICLLPTLVALANWRTLTQPDLLGYAGGVNQILSNGHVPTQNIQTNVSQWPMSYILWAMTVLEIRLGTETTNSFLLLAGIITMSCAFLVLGRLVNRQYAPGIALMGFALTINPFYRVGFFSDTFFAGALAFLFITLVCSWATSTRVDHRVLTIAVVLISVIVFGHPFWSVQLVGYAVLASLLIFGKNPWWRNIAMTAITIFVTQLAYSAIITSYPSFFNPSNLGLNGFRHGLEVFLSGRTSATVVGSQLAKEVSQGLVTGSDGLIGLVLFVALLGSIRYKSLLERRVSWYKHAWMFAIAVGFISPVVVFSADPGGLPRLPAEAMPLIGIVAGACLIQGRTSKKVLPFFGAVTLLILFLAAISINPLVFVPTQKLAQEGYYLHYSRNTVVSVDNNIIGPEIRYLDPTGMNLRIVSTPMVIDGSYLTLLSNRDGAKYSCVVSNDGLFAIFETEVAAPSLVLPVEPS